MKALILTLLFTACSQQEPVSQLVPGKIKYVEPQNDLKHHRFRDAKKWSTKFDHPKRGKWQKPSEILKLMQIKEGDRVADIGAGTGYMLPYLSKAVGKSGRVYGMDIEDTLVAHMTKRISDENLNNTIAEIIPKDDPRLLGKEINKVLFVNTWHHIKRPVEYAVKIRDSLVRNGIVFLVEPDPNVKSKFGPKHKIQPEIFLAQWRAAGFSCHKHKENLPYQYIISCLVLY